MATSYIVSLALPILILAVTHGCSGKVVAPTENRTNCEQQHLQQIKELVRAFSGDKDWAALTTGLDAVLDHGSAEYTQLQKVANSFTSPTYYTGLWGLEQLASLLLCGQLPVDTADTRGNNLLTGAADGAHAHLVRLLLQSGADVNASTSTKTTPLMGAVVGGSLEVVQTLVQAGADTSARDADGQTAFAYAESWQRTAIAHYLQDYPH